MTTRIYGFTALTGGGTGALDKYPESGMPALATDDYAFGHVDGAFYLYWFDGASSEAESPPDVIAPNSGSGRWILKSFSSNHNDLMNIDGGNASPEEYYHLASALYNVINSATAQSIIANPTGGATSVTNVTVAEQTLVGRITGGNVDALSVAQVKTLIGDVSDTAYGTSWDGVTDVAPSKNAVYDKIELLAPKDDPVFTGVVSSAILTSTNPLFSAKVTATVENCTGVNNIVTYYTLRSTSSPACNWTEITDRATNFSGGTFTAPVTGNYLFTGFIELSGLSGNNSWTIVHLITSNRTYNVTNINSLGIQNLGNAGYGFSVIADMDTADTAYLEIVVYDGTNAKTVDITTSTHFQGYLLP